MPNHEGGGRNAVDGAAGGEDKLEEVKTTELVTFSRPGAVSTLVEVGLMLDETRTFLAKLQASMLCGQVAAYAAHHRVCAACDMPQPLKERRTRRLQTLFGTVEVEAPRFKVCRCRQPVPMAEVTVSPVCALLTARCTPVLERVQAELGARTSFRDGVRILEALLPVSPVNHESLRTRTHAVALQLEAADRQAAAEVTAVGHAPDKAGVADEHRPIVMPDGAYIRAVPSHQVRNFDAICGKMEREGHPTRRFALVRSVAEQPHALLRAALRDQSWREGDAVTAISDGDPALPALVRSATGGLVELILDWSQLSMRVHHVEQVMGGLCALEPPPSAPPDQARIDVGRLQHLLWNRHHEKAYEALVRITGWAKDASVLDDPTMGARAKPLVARCTELRSYIETNEGALIDYGQRCRAGKPISTSRAEGTVNPLVSARMNKRHQMRWSPRGARRVLQVRTAVLGWTVWPPSPPARGVAPRGFDTLHETISVLAWRAASARDGMRSPNWPSLLDPHDVPQPESNDHCNAGHAAMSRPSPLT